MRRMIYPDVDKCRALVIDSNPTSRSILGSMLREMGVGMVVNCSRVVEARRTLENRVFDIVLCDYHFDNSPGSGQDLLDDLRRSQLLPYETVFVMVTGEATYRRVAEVAEAALDSYLLKPHTALALEERLMQARHRKLVLKSIFDAMALNDFETAAQLCEARFRERGEYWLYAARVGAELYLRLGQHAQAQALYQAILDAKALPWAKLGVARAEAEQGKLPQAKRTLESLISEAPTYADAYDVMGRVQVDQGDLNSALETFRNASHLTPDSITRLQKQGMLAFYLGNTEEAAQALERSVRIGISSKMFDCQSLVLLAFLQHDQRDLRAFQRNHDNVALAAEKRPNSARLQRFLAISELLLSLLQEKNSAALNQLRGMAEEIPKEDFDFESASNLLSVLGRMGNRAEQLSGSAGWVSAMALRYCVSKASTELLSQAVKHHPPYQDLVREGQQEINTMAEKAMAHSLSGSPGAAVKALMIKGGETYNAKLIDLAGAVLQRHTQRIDPVHAADMMQSINTLKKRYCSQGTQVSLGGAENTRAPGGLNLRTAAPAAADTAGAAASTSTPPITLQPGAEPPSAAEADVPVAG